ncbi:MAG: hypothetical protein IPK70_14075 [Flavobacteriales bacterium]|nr:hypothetical protein [Flavobacteriales bacterium]
MRWLLLPFPLTLFAQAPAIPERRWQAPSFAEASALLSCGMGVYGDTVLTWSSRLKPAHARLSGIVIRTHGDSTYSAIMQYSEGRRCGTWFEFEPTERVEEIRVYAPDSTQEVFRYDPHGHLEEYCLLRGWPDDAFDRIFGGGGSGQCWSFDSLARITYYLDSRSVEEQTMIHYYPNGQMAERRWHSRNDRHFEQWCPSGKRVGSIEVRSDGNGKVIYRQGHGIEWSVAEYSYYHIRMKNDRFGLRRLPGGRWRSYDEAEFHAIATELRLRRVVFNDPERPAELPCWWP